MKSGRNIVFLGMMGSGKTSIGFLVSKKLKLDFYDVDHYIENKLKMKISNIFKNKGEKFFREYEEKITLELMKIKGIVVSLGGGAFLNKNIRKSLTIPKKCSDFELRNLIKVFGIWVTHCTSSLNEFKPIFEEAYH